MVGLAERADEPRVVKRVGRGLDLDASPVGVVEKGIEHLIEAEVVTVLDTSSQGRRGHAQDP